MKNRYRRITIVLFTMMFIFTGCGAGNSSAGVSDEDTEAIVELSSESTVQTRSMGTENTYIVNINTDKFHWPDCGDVKKMSDSNKKEVTASLEEMLQRYEPCEHCNPGY